jgi:Lrp/AsnC family transcriptional regulator, leucine-responsive regulatory protein
MLDTIDKKILTKLQSDGRTSNLDLSAHVGLSPPACLGRVRKLQDEGYILGFTAQLAAERLDISLLAFMKIVLDRTIPDIFANFRRHVEAMPEVLECHLIAGGFDYLVKTRAKDMSALREFLVESLLKETGVLKVYAYPVIEEVKNASRLPV